MHSARQYLPDGTFSKAIFISAALAMFVSGCKPAGRKDDASITSSRPASSKAGLYVIDGTTNKSGLTVISSLYEEWPNPYKVYQKGLDGPLGTILAAGALDINKKILEQICRHLDSQAVEDVFLAGFSRGAIQALGLAIDITKKSKCQRQPKSVWLGLVDAVNTSMPTWDDTVPDGVYALHIKKDPNFEHADMAQKTVLKTKEIKGVNRIFVPSLSEWPHDHGSIGIMNLTWRVLRDSAIAHGAPLKGVPELLEQIYRDFDESGFRKKK